MCRCGAGVGTCCSLMLMYNYTRSTHRYGIPCGVKNVHTSLYGTYSQLLNQSSKRKIQHMYGTYSLSKSYSFWSFEIHHDIAKLYTGKVNSNAYMYNYTVCCLQQHHVVVHVLCCLVLVSVRNTRWISWLDDTNLNSISSFHCACNVAKLLKIILEYLLCFHGKWNYVLIMSFSRTQ